MIVCTIATQTTGIGSCISTTWADIIVMSLPMKSHIQNTNGTNKGKNSSEINTKVMPSCVLIPRNDMKKHTAITQSGRLKIIGGKNMMQKRQFIIRLYLVSTIEFKLKVDILDTIADIPANNVFRYISPPMYFV